MHHDHKLLYLCNTHVLGAAVHQLEQVVIENPPISPPYDEPKEHFRFTDEGIANKIIQANSARLKSSMERCKQ